MLALNDEDIKALCAYRMKKTAKVQVEIRKANVAVANLLRQDLLALGFEDADIKKGGSRLTRLILEPHGIASIAPQVTQPNASTQQGISRKRANMDKQLRYGDASQLSAIPESAENVCSTKKRKTDACVVISSPRHNDSTPRAEGQHFSANVHSHPVEAEVKERQRMGNSRKLSQGPCSQGQ
jgi:hypothetical protein